MANVLFKKGLLANLPETYAAGTFYVTTDERAMYLDVDDSTRIRLGDFIQVDTIADLPSEGASTTALYYVVDSNILAKWNGEDWTQINKQPTTEEMKTLLGLGTAAYTDATAYDEAGAAAAAKAEVLEYVGEIPADDNGDPIAASVIDYVDKKTTGIATDTTVAGKVDKVAGHSLVADTEIAKLATVSEGANKVENVGGGKIKIDGEEVTVYAHPDKHAKTDLDDALVAEIDGKVKSVAAGDASVTVGGTATEPTVAVKLSAAEGNAIELAEDGLKVILPESTKVEASETNGNIKVDGEEVVVYTHPENHTIDEVTGLQDALDGKETAGAAAQALVDAKAYVDSEDVFHTDIVTVNALGGIAAGANLNNMTTHEILNTLLFPYVAFTINSSSRNAAAATLENGATQTLSSATISVTKKSKPIESITLYNGSTILETKTGDAVAAGGSITFNGFDAITVSKSNNPNLKFTVSDGQTSTDKNVGASTFVYPYYWGECAADATIDEALVESLTKKVESKGNKTVTHTMSNGRMVIAYPKAHGVLKSILDPNNFETIGDYSRTEVSVTGLDGTAQTYYVYASGAATVSSFKVQYKY